MQWYEGAMTLSDAQSYWSLSAQEVDRIWKLLLGKEQTLNDGRVGYLVGDLEWAVQEVWKGRRR